MKHLMKCEACHTYTFKETCCDKPTINPRPPKYDPQDKYGEYRRRAKEENNDVEFSKNPKIT